MSQPEAPKLLVRLKYSKPANLDAMTSATRAGTPTRGTWSNGEIGLLFNYADECLRDKKDYRSTIGTRLLDYSGRSLKLGSDLKQLHNRLSKYNQRASTSDLLREGSKCLDIRLLPLHLVIEMRQQRLQWGLGELETGDSASSGNGTADSKAAQSSKQQRNLPRRYHDRTVSESGSSQTDDLTDLEYTEGTRESDTVTSADSRKVAVFRPADRQSAPKAPPRVVGQAAAARTAPSSAPPVGATVQKRKASLNDVIVLDDESPPPPKRPASKKSLAAAVVSSKPSTAPPHPHIRDARSVPLQGPSLDTPQRQSPLQARPARENAPPQALPTNATPTQVPLLSLPTPAVRDGSTVRQAQTPNKSIEGQLEDLQYLVVSLLRERLETGKKLTPDMAQRLKTIPRSMEQEPGKLAQRLLINSKAADAVASDLSNQFRAVFSRQEPGARLNFPPMSDQRQIDKKWTAIRQGIKEAFTNDLGLMIKGPALTGVSAGYLACTIDGLLEDPRPRKNPLAKLVTHLKSPHAAQSLMGALSCRWLFATPDPMCEGQHNDLVVKQYESVLLSDGAEEVQRTDKLGFSLLFADPKFHGTNLQNAATRLVERFSKIIRQAYPAAPGLEGLEDSDAWAQGALKLKQTLMISPKDYRVHFCLPETPFDPTWMTAEDAEGNLLPAAQMKAKKITICLFPALVEQEAEAFGKNAGIAEALVKNKNFFPTWQEKAALDPKKVISKAVVLVV